MVVETAIILKTVYNTHTLTFIMTYAFVQTKLSKVIKKKYIAELIMKSPNYVHIM